MSQPGNYRYQSYDQTGTSKGGPPPMVNGQPGPMQHTQNGIQPPSFNSAGTPSSQSSRDPSREPSRDPSPTQYLHNQYRPQLSRPPMPPINGQQQISMSQQQQQQQPRVQQSSQSTPASNIQNTNQFPNIQTSNASSIYTPQTPQFQSSSPAQSLSSDSQIHHSNQTQKSVTPTRYDFPSPNRTIAGSQSATQAQTRPSTILQSGQTSVGQNLPTTIGQSSITTQSSWSKDNSSFVTSSESTTATIPNQTWSNQNLEKNSNNSQTAVTSQTSVILPSSSKESSLISTSQPNLNQPATTTMTMTTTTTTTTTTSQIWQNPSDVNSNKNQNYGILHQSSVPSRNQLSTSQNPNFIAPPTTSTQISTSYLEQSGQTLTNKSNLGNPGNVRNVQATGAQSTPIITGMSTQNVLGQTSQHFSNQSLSQKTQNPQISHSSLPKPQPHYPTTQPNVLGNQPNSTKQPNVLGNQPNVSTLGANSSNFTSSGVNPPNFTSPGVKQPIFSSPAGNQRIFTTPPTNQPTFTTPGAKQPNFTAPVPNQPNFTTPGANQPNFTSPGTNQPNISYPGAIPPNFTPLSVNQSNQSAYVSQQNVASQRKYPQSPYSSQPPSTMSNSALLHPGVTQSSIIPPPSAGQLPQPPPTSVAPPQPSPVQMPRPPPTSVVPPQPSPGQMPRPPPTSVISPQPSPGQLPRPPPTSMPPSQSGQQPEGHYDYRTPYFGQMSNVPLDNMTKRYPTAAYPDQNQLNAPMQNLNVTQSGFNDLWGQQTIDLLQCRNILSPEKVEPPRIKLHQEFLDSVNCSPEIFRCTLTRIPESNSLLQKCRLPLGVLIHPFKDLNHLPVIQCSTIVRCRACRTYINPFVYFVDSKRWKCNLCYRVNELPEEFQFDPVTKSYGDPSRRPEVKTSTIEFIAPSEYMLRPPQPAVYLFILDVSRLAVDSGYLTVVCETIAEELTKLPGDGRTQVGFMAVDSAIHFFSMPENVSQPHELIMLDIDDVFLPCPDNLVVNLKEREELVRDLLEQLPTKFNGTQDTNSALGAALQAAFKLMSPTGGRISVFQTCLPNVGPGALTAREDPNTRASKDVPHLNPATDFYKRLALDCSGQQIAVDLFLLNSQYSDLATLSGMCRFSGGCIYHIPLFRRNKPQHSETLEKILRRYLTRKIGFEAVMRIRCTRGLSIHTFHGNFFVRSTDLLSLPNVNPDAGFGMQVSIEENLSDVQSICFQAALLYTSSKGERRIRIHTLCLPVSSSMTDILYSADQQAIIGLLSKMAVDRSQQSSLSDARDALINVAIDALSAYKLSQSASSGGLLAPGNLKLLPLYIIAMIKCLAFRSGTSTRLDDRIFSMCQMKSLPLGQLIQMIYPDLYPVHALDDLNSKDVDGKICPQAPRLHLSAEKLDFRGVFLMDAGDRIFIYVGKSVDTNFCTNVLGVAAFVSIPEEFYDLPILDTVESERLRNFIFSLQEDKPYYAPLQIIRDDSHFRSLFTDRLIEDRFENALSYYEFLQHLKTQVK